MSYTLNRYTTKSWADTERELGHCFDQWGVSAWSAEPNVPHNRVNQVTFAPGETAVTVRYTKAGNEIVLTMDSQAWPAGNLRALFLCIDAMRLLEVRGMADTVRSAYRQLEAPRTQRDPWEVLQVRPDADWELVEAAYKVAARRAHPDTGGSTAAMVEVNEAFEALKKQRQ